MASELLEVKKRDLALHSVKKGVDVKSLSEKERKAYIRNSAVEDILRTVMKRDDEIRKKGNVLNAFKRAVE